MRFVTRIALVLSFLLAGCASSRPDLAQYLPPDAPPYSRAPAPPDGYALVYLYRIGAYPRLHLPDILINNQFAWEPPEHAYTWVHVKAGYTDFQIKWTFSGWPNLSFTRPLKGGETYYLKFYGGHEGAAPVKLSTMARFVEPAEAENELRSCCRFIPPGKYNAPRQRLPIE